MAFRIYTKTGDKGTTSLIGGTKVTKSHLRIEAYGTVDECNSFIGLLGDHLATAQPPAAIPTTSEAPALPTSAVPAPANSEAPATTPSRTPAPAASDVPATTPSEVPAPSGIPAPLTSEPPAPAPSQHPAPLPGDILPFLREIQDRLFTIGASLACDPEKEPKFAIPDLHEADIRLLEEAIDAMDTQLPPMKSFILPGGHVAISTAHIARCICRRAERCVVRLMEDEPVEPLVLQYLNRLSDYLFQLARFIGHREAVPEIPWKPRT